MPGLLLSGFPPRGPEWTMLLVAALAVGAPLLAARLRLPGMIGLLLGGMVIGPNVLEWLPREGSVAGIGTIGLLFLMFMAGVELDLDDFRRNRSDAVRFGALTFALPMGIGIAAALWLLDYDTGAAILFGSLWASHTLVAYPIARERGQGGSRAVAMVVGGTVITDTLALLVLAIVVGLDGGGDATTLTAKILLGLAALVAGTLLLLPRLVRLVFAGPGTEMTLRFLTTLAAMSGVALIAHEVGLEGIIGAFFAGLALNRLVPNRGRLMEHLEFFGSSLLVPFFLVSTGMLLDPAALVDGATLKAGGAGLLAVICGKGLAAWAGGRPLRLGAAETGVVFTLSVAQAAATLAAVIVGFEAGIFDETLVNGALVVVLVSLVVATVGTEIAARRMPAADAEAGARLGAHALVPVVDDTAPARVAIAARLAAADGGVVVPVTVLGPGDDADRRGELRRRLDDAVARLGSEGIECEPVVRIDESVPLGVVHAATEHEASCVVAGFRATLRARSLLGFRGNVDLIDGLGVPLLVVNPGTGRPGRVVLAVAPGDLQPARVGALALAAEAARRLAADDEVVVLHPASALPDLPAEGRWAPEPYRGNRLRATGEAVGPDDLVVFAGATSGDGIAPESLALLAVRGRPTVVCVLAPLGEPGRARMLAVPA